MFTRLTKSAKWKGTNYIWTMQNLCNIYCCERLTILHSFCTEVGIVNAKKYVMPKFWQRSDLLSFKIFFLFFSSRSAKWEICQNNSGNLEIHETCFAFSFVTFYQYQNKVHRKILKFSNGQSMAAAAAAVAATDAAAAAPLTWSPSPPWPGGPRDVAPSPPGSGTCSGGGVKHYAEYKCSSRPMENNVELYDFCTLWTTVIWVIIVMSSVVDPNTLKLDPDPEFWPHLDLDSDLLNNFERIN